MFKKVLAVALATTMVCSVATVASADTTGSLNVDKDQYGYFAETTDANADLIEAINKAPESVTITIQITQPEETAGWGNANYGCSVGEAWMKSPGDPLTFASGEQTVTFTGAVAPIVVTSIVALASTAVLVSRKRA